MRELSGIIILGALSLLVGLVSGVICALFHMALTHADALRVQAVTHAQASPWVGLPLLVGGTAAAAAFAAGLVRRVAPEASGSGIPHVEAVLEQEMQPARGWLIPVKFTGGVLAIGSGLALGREGPSVQMAAATANVIGRFFRRNWEDRRALLAGGAGAGLAAAFNAPAAGAVFVLEELVGKFEPRIAVVALGTSIGAIFASRGLLGGALDFPLPQLSGGGPEMLPLFLLMGVLVGLVSVVYNRSLLGTLRLADRIGGPIELRAAVIGGAVGLLAFAAPDLVGGGDAMVTRMTQEQVALALLPLLFLVRLLLSTVSYAAGTPGGLFAPMLALGAITGLAFGLIVQALAPGLGVAPAAFAVVAMGAFFAGAVRAPLTGIILVIEMTGASDIILPLLTACFGSMLVTQALREPPIYVSLRERAAQSER
ncbi:H(+)/Cl(-) exchange transporter ClcA [Marinibacterium profundimaris]|uniref:Chloride channel protein n=1 Tax=Marinibacterium profundimaris TaxID=1679460 RepID=A0A225NFA5_9RHOB|nr:H(+)/Cl(-) exchange transporter ClcA [Marinibacterium profundimaris]OWU71644.1 hypothetical protein ATO3_17695 [Marinibacterium profundimaris]